MFNNEGNQILFIELMDAFPVALNDISMAWNNNNTLYKTHVTFNFRDYNVSVDQSRTIPRPLDNNLPGLSALSRASAS